MSLRVARLHGRAILPSRAYPGDAGLDLYALEPARLEPWERALIRTGIAVEVPPGQAGLVLPRSGLATSAGIALVNAPGLIDSGYRGEIRVLLLNTDRATAFSVAAEPRKMALATRRVTVRCPSVGRSRSTPAGVAASPSMSA